MPPAHRPAYPVSRSRLRSRWVCGLLIWLLGSLGPALGEERSVHVRWLGAEEGLLQSSILGLHQDAEGFVWIATQGGLHRYDGHRMLRFRQQPDHPEGLPENFVTAMADAAGGGLFAGTRSSGLFRIDAAQRVQSVPLHDDDVAHRSIRALTAEGARLWVASAAGVHRLDARGIETAWHWPEPDIAARRLLPLQDGAWVATDRGLYRVEKDTIRRLPVDGPIHDLADADGGQLWLARADGLHLYDTTSSRSRRIWPKPGEAPEAVLRIGRGAGDQLWLARGREGLLRLTPRTGEAFPLKPDGRIPGSLQNDVFVNLLVDRSGLVWTGTEFSGVALFDGDLSPFSLIVDPDRGAAQQVPDRVRALYEAAPGVLLIGSEADGLKRYHRQSQQFDALSAEVNQALGLPPDSPLRIYSIQSDAAGGLLLATQAGIVRWPAGGAPVRLPGIPAGDPVRTLLLARDGRLWAGTTARGVQVLQLDGGNVLQLPAGPDGLTDNLITALHEDARGRIWIGTTAGLNRIDPDGAIQRYQREPEQSGTLPSHGVRTLFESRSGELWLGTFAGLARVVEDADGLRFERIVGLDDPLDDTIYGILEDSSGRFWLSTNHGIVRLDPQRRETRRYGIEDGLQGLEFNGGAQLTTADGELMFGGVHGISAFRPDRIRDSRYSPPLVLTEVTAGRSSLLADPGHVLELDQADRYFRFDFAALDYYAPGRNRFRYRLDGWDSDWTEGRGIGQAIYMNLPAGRYRLRVQGSNHDGLYSAQELVLPLRLRAPWYASALAQGAAVLLLLGGALTLIWFAIDRRRQRRTYLHDLYEREERLRVALWGSNESYWDWDMLTDTLHREGAERVLGRKVASVASREDYRTRDIHPEDYERVMGRVAAHARGETEHFEAQYRMRGGSGQWVWVCARGRVVERSADGKPLRLAGTLRNIDSERSAERERILAAEVLASMAEAVAVLDLQLHFVSVNPAFERLSGREAASLAGAELSALSSTRHAEIEFEMIRNALRTDGQWRGELWQRRADGAEYLLEIELRKLGDAIAGGRDAELIVAVGSDVTEKRRAEQELRYLANFDVLTGLPNRTMLLSRLGTAITRARALKEQVAILFIDLDRFKPINDSLGHAAGDELLRSLGRRLTEVLGPEMLVARLAGDEFTVVVEHVRDTATVYRTANRLLSSLGDPIAVLGNELSVTPSIGIALYPSHGDNAADLLKSADAAMYSAKSAGRNTFRVYNAELAAQAQQRLQMEAALRRALDRGEFRLLYQPILALKTNRIIGLEALLRWQHPRFGFVGPDRFIPILEETGLISTVGRWVIDAAVEDLARWHAAGHDGIKMAVNVSTLQLLRNELKDEIAESLARHGVDGTCLELEVTESLLMTNPDATAQTLTDLKSLGVGVAIDDFGTGYSSLSYLKRLPIDKLKIDQSFVRDLGQGGEDHTIVNMIIAMAHALGIRATAEGVETLEQLRFLEQQGCDEVQGYLIAKPQPAAEIGKLLQRPLPGRSLAS
jgi:diguanylate cyclase (GGDEF)-like protein/PAS domain S-box-containing protein